MGSEMPAEDDTEGWRSKFLEYYAKNAPSKAKMVTDGMMTKWAGKYGELYANLEKKYGQLGSPIEPPAAPSRMSSAGKTTIADYHDNFVKLVAKATPPHEKQENVVHSSMDELAIDGGIETSTFTVCARARPVLEGDGLGGENFGCVVRGKEQAEEETALVLKPKLSLRGDPKLEPTSFALDRYFDADSTDDEIFDAVGRKLVRRAMEGQVGVVFAYGQTGSGKTHTMSNLMERVVDELFFLEEKQQQVSFSYMELLGPAAHDCLAGGDDGSGKPVKIGETLDGRILAEGLTVHAVESRSSLLELVAVAKSRRLTKATERNAESSRSHGVGILRVEPAEGCSLQGCLYVIDLAGSERAADSKDHDAERLAETKQINLSLMALKECIRARAAASIVPGQAAAANASKTHIPYRRSKLTLLIKDVFDVASPRICSTVVIANISPLARDVNHSMNTLSYAAPLRIASARAAAASKNNPKKLETDLRDPALWDSNTLLTWVAEQLPSSTASCLEVVVGGLRGAQFCALPEPKMVARCVAAGFSADEGRKLYATVWTFVVDAKTRKRRPDGSILTPEDEQRDIEVKAQALKDKTALWASREASLRAEH